MSPPRFVSPGPPRVVVRSGGIAASLGRELRAERLRRSLSLHDVAVRAGASKSAVHAIESGRPSSLEGYVRLADALGLEPGFSLHRKRHARSTDDVDPVHAAMGEAEAAHLSAFGLDVMLDEPYGHYQFSGRADLIAVDREMRALLHLENRTRCPDVQAAIGSYNAKRAYLAPELARRLGIRGEFRSVTHVIVALWSAEALHGL
jgi:transcriptional regulator with XRE-family HTH domain